MNRVLIAGITGVAGFIGAAVAVPNVRNLKAIPVVLSLLGVAVSSAGLVARKQCLQKDERLTKYDFMVLGGAGIAGSVLGGAAVVVAETILGLTAISYILGKPLVDSVARRY